MGRRNFKVSRSTIVLTEEEGMTLIEAIVSLAIFAIIATLAIFALKPALQLARARDARRKTDLKRIAIALEDYAGDHPCYPSAIYTAEENECKPSTEIDPYLRKIPCDPKTRQHYPYDTSPDGCSQYVVYATLELENIITYGSGNYVMTSSNMRVVPTLVLSPTPAGLPPPVATSTPSPSPDNYWGCFNGVCLPIAGPWVCPITKYQWPDCHGSCSNPINECH